MRQGDLISVEIAGLESMFSGVPYLLVITHSCDISNSSEPFLEVLPCHPIAENDGNKTNGKNPRELHFTVKGDTCFSAHAFEKARLPKGSILDCSICFSLHSQEQMLQNWLASRYRRQALDDSINKMLLQMKLRSFVLKYSDCLCGIWLSSEEIGGSESTGDYQDFDIKLFFVFDTSDALCEANLAAFEGKIQKRLRDRHINQANVSTYCVRDDAFTFKEVMALTFVNFDYLSNDKATIA
jgi:hypothetical protein